MRRIVGRRHRDDHSVKQLDVLALEEAHGHHAVELGARNTARLLGLDEIERDHLRYRTTPRRAELTSPMTR